MILEYFYQAFKVKGSVILLHVCETFNLADFESTLAEAKKELNTFDFVDLEVQSSDKFFTLVGTRNMTKTERIAAESNLSRHKARIAELKNQISELKTELKQLEAI